MPRNKQIDRQVDAETVTLGDVKSWLARRGNKKQIAALDRYKITAHRPYGVAVGDLRRYAKEIGTDHQLAEQLWRAQRYEARMLAAFVDDPQKVGVRQMNAWARDFDNWAIVDTVCFHLFDRTAHAWKQVPRWAEAKPEFTKRAAFAMLWSLSVHDKAATNTQFLSGLELIEHHAEDERNFVKKAVNMALRAIGKRNAPLNLAATKVANRLAASDTVTARWIGKNAVRELTSDKTLSRFQ